MACMTEWASPRMVIERLRSAGAKRLQGGKYAVPARLPELHQLVAAGRRIVEFPVAMPIRFLAVGGEEVGPTRAHVPRHVLDDGGDRVHLRVEHGDQLLVGDLFDRGFGSFLVMAKQRQSILDVRGGEFERHVAIIRTIGQDVTGTHSQSARNERRCPKS